MDFTGERYVPQVEGDIRTEHLHRYLVARRLVQGKRVLDIACGEGYGSDLLADAAAKVIGVDLDEAAVAHAQQTYVRPNIEFLHGDATAIPLADSSVDVVVSFETIEHLTDHRAMMLEIKRVLAAGGVLVLSTPDRHEYSDVPRYRNPFHLRELYLSELQALLGEHFRKHAIYGQRVQYASVLAPAAGQSPFICYRDDEGGVVEGPGLPNPVYFIAVASDEALPELPAGMFIPREPPYLRDIAALTDARQHLVAEVEQRGRQVDQLTTQAEELRGELAAQAHRQRQMQEEMDQRGQRLDELAGLLRASTAEAENLRERLAELERQHAEAVGFSQLLLGSRSWRATAPLRNISVVLRRAKQRLYRSAATTARISYRAMPLDIDSKIRLKNYLFNHMGPLFAGTGAYARWQEQRVARQGPAFADDVAMPPAEPAHAESPKQAERKTTIPAFTAPPTSLPDLKDCEFYHVMDLPGVGTVGRQWDLRGQADEYLGYVDFAGKRVLEIGPASGYLTAEMERRGADVVCLEIPTEPGWDYVPYPQPEMAETRRQHSLRMGLLKNSFWYVHRTFNLKARVAHGRADALPDGIGRFDIVTLAAVLLHAKNPHIILAECARHADMIVITEPAYPNLEGQGPVMRLRPTADNKHWGTWWEFTSAFFVQYLGVLGFPNHRVSHHEQKTLDRTAPWFTVVAWR